MSSAAELLNPRTLGCNLVTSRTGATNLYAPGDVSDNHSPPTYSSELIHISLKCKIHPPFHLVEMKKGGREILESQAGRFGESVQVDYPESR